MYSTRRHGTSSDTQELRREVGRWLKKRREACGLTQRQFAEKIKADYYTHVSQLETGRGRIPPDKYSAWATAFGMQPRDFVMAILPYYDPVIYDILFASENIERDRVS